LPEQWISKPITFFSIYFQSSIVRSEAELSASAEHYSDRDMKICCVPFGSTNTDVSSTFDWYFV